MKVNKCPGIQNLPCESLTPSFHYKKEKHIMLHIFLFFWKKCVYIKNIGFELNLGTGYYFKLELLSNMDFEKFGFTEEFIEYLGFFCVAHRISTKFLHNIHDLWVFFHKILCGAQTPWLFLCSTQNYYQISSQYPWFMNFCHKNLCAAQNISKLYSFIIICSWNFIIFEWCFNVQQVKMNIWYIIYTIHIYHLTKYN